MVSPVPRGKLQSRQSSSDGDPEIAIPLPMGLGSGVDVHGSGPADPSTNVEGEVGGGTDGCESG